MTCGAGTAFLSCAYPQNRTSRPRRHWPYEFFIPTPQGMVPTPGAEMRAQSLRNELSGMQHAREPAAFDPPASDRRFALAANNYAVVALQRARAASLGGLLPLC